MGRKGEQDLARGSALSQAMVLVWGGGGVLCPVHQLRQPLTLACSKKRSSLFRKITKQASLLHTSRSLSSLNPLDRKSNV